MRSYQYGGVSYPNPDAVTLIANGIGSTSLAYDSDGNLIQSILSSAGHSTTTLYSWNYRNELTETDIGNGSATTSTTYGYDYAGNRVLQTMGSSTTIYPNKWTSIVSTLSGATTYATSTNYYWNADTLVGYTDQPMINGAATGTSATYYVHPDHLKSSNVVTNASGTAQIVKDYYPYGSVRVSSGLASLGRGYIDQFEDSTGLDYENARYYNSAQGEFLSEDPVFIAIGNPIQLAEVDQGRPCTPMMLKPYVISLSGGWLVIDATFVRL